MSKEVWTEGVFRHFDTLVEIEVNGFRLKVPENNTILRCFQYLNAEAFLSGNYCWNGDCTNCIVWLEESPGKTKKTLACQTVVNPGMRIVETAPQLKSDMGF